MKKQNNRNLASTIITADIRVSTGLVPSSTDLGGPFTYIESWIFSDDPRIKSRQIVHGTRSGHLSRQDLTDAEYREAMEWHSKVAWALTRKYSRRAQLEAERDELKAKVEKWKNGGAAILELTLIDFALQDAKALSGQRSEADDIRVLAAERDRYRAALRRLFASLMDQAETKEAIIEGVEARKQAAQALEPPS